ncbi:MAG: PDZ domain-containing protein [Solirubrobacteraceae bacterium]|nr:PDZ domain-containing protein [Solirubrobacteraceae bacterium]
MTQRMIAACVSVPLLLGLIAVAVFVPVPFASYHPGPTFDVLGEEDGQEIIQVNGAKTYRDDGEIRMTTVSVSQEGVEKNLFEMMGDWIDPDSAVYPYDIVHPPGTTREQEEIEGQVQMVSSQGNAIAAALRQLDYDVEPALEVLSITPASPADGALAVRDKFVSVDGVALTPDQAGQDALLEAIQNAEDGQKLSFVVLRDGKEVTVPVGTAEVTDDDGTTRRQIGIGLGLGFIFPFTVSVNISDNIGGPSAGLLFALAIYDTLTPGSLTGGQDVAGTGELDAEGVVGPIGGIQQKIAGAREAGADLFLVPEANCPDALGADNGDMRLVRATTFVETLDAVEDWVEDPDADLPSCEDAA